MWFWKPSQPDLGQVLDRLARIESDTKLLRLEWQETYDKVSHLVGRLRKRDRDAANAGTPPTGDVPPAAALGPTDQKVELWRRAALIRGNHVVQR